MNMTNGQVGTARAYLTVRMAGPAIRARICTATKERGR